MTRRRSPGLAAALALFTLSTSPIAAQSVSLAVDHAPARARPVALKRDYRVRLESAWPQLSGPDGCINGGRESLAGTLSLLPDGTYAGTFARKTTLLFCGAHGAEAGSACALTLEGEGEVNVTAIVLADAADPSGNVARLAWVPAPGHAATVTGACSSAFKEAVQAMYLNAHHGVELPLTQAGSAPVSRRLQDYAWTVVVE